MSEENKDEMERLDDCKREEQFPPMEPKIEQEKQFSEGNEEMQETEQTEALKETTESENGNTDAENGEEGFAKPIAPKEAGAKEKPVKGMMIGLIIIVIGLLVCWKGSLFSADKKADLPIAYAKDNALYMDDLKNEPYKVADGISSGGSYNYYYTAWGVNPSEDGKVAYYIKDVKTDGTFDLYKKSTDAKSQDNELVGKGVASYRISKDGSVCAYVKLDEEKGAVLYANSGKGEILLAEGIVMDEKAYDLDKDGSFVIFGKETTEGKMELCSAATSGGEVKTLTKSLAQYILAAETGKVYFVGEKAGSYDIYEYTFGSEPKLIANKVTAMELMGNGKELFYCTQSAETIKTSDIIEDDLAKKDAAVKKPDADNGTEGNKADYDKAMEEYNAKATRDTMRSALKEDTMESPLQTCYIWSDGKAVEVGKDLLNAKAVEDKNDYVLISKIDTSHVEKIKLSAVHSIDEAKYMYFMSLSQAPKSLHLLKVGKKAAELERVNMVSDSLSIAPEQNRIVFTEVDTITGGTKLVTAALGGDGRVSDYADVAANAEKAVFCGKGDSLVYLTEYNNGMGKLNVFSGKEAVVLSEKVSGYRVSEDSNAVYYICDTNMNTGNGSLKMFADGKTTDLDSDVFAMQYKGNGKLVYMKNYDIASGKGDLYYWNGRETRLIDKGVSSIFIY